MDPDSSIRTYMPGATLTNFAAGGSGGGFRAFRLRYRTRTVFKPAVPGVAEESAMTSTDSGVSVPEPTASVSPGPSVPTSVTAPRRRSRPPPYRGRPGGSLASTR